VPLERAEAAVRAVHEEFRLGAEPASDGPGPGPRGERA